MTSVLPTPVPTPVMKSPLMAPPMDQAYGALSIAPPRGRSSSGSCIAEKANRSRAVPGGTDGGRIATTRSPCCSSIAEAARRALRLAQDHGHDRARRRRPSQGGRESPGVLERPRATAGRSSRMIRSAAAAAATDAGGRPVENIRAASAVLQPGDQLGRAADIPAAAADRLRERPHLHVGRVVSGRCPARGRRRSSARRHGRGPARPARRPGRDRRPC